MSKLIACSGGFRYPYFEGEVPLITDRQKKQLTELLFQNVADPYERELRLMELEDLTEADADYTLFQFSSGIWN